jgi:hypothetical protein
MPEDMSQIVTEKEKENRYGSTHNITPTLPLADNLKKGKKKRQKKKGKKEEKKRIFFLKKN